MSEIESKVIQGLTVQGSVVVDFRALGLVGVGHRAWGVQGSRVTGCNPDLGFWLGQSPTQKWVPHGTLVRFQ